jgi:hypothetical protein
MDSIRVMISSRVNSPLAKSGKTTVGDAAKEIASSLGDLRLFPKADFDTVPLFQFNLSLADTSMPADKTVDQHCREMVMENDVILVLYNGQAGSQLQGNSDGICFLEMRTAMDYAPDKLVVVRLPLQTSPTAAGQAADARFSEWFERQEFWASEASAGGVPAVVDAASQALRAAVTKMVQKAGKTRTGNFHVGGALEWTRMNYERRAAAMRQAVRDALPATNTEVGGANAEETTVELEIGGEKVFTCIHAAPAALSEPRAREMVGQPYLRDHEYAKALGKLPGPLHIVACARGATESQAIRILGFPDATIIKAPFGVYVADEIQKIQMAFLAQCRDEPTTRDAVAQFIAWLDRTGEGKAIVARGHLRSKLVSILAENIAGYADLPL